MFVEKVTPYGWADVHEFSVVFVFSVAVINSRTFIFKFSSFSEHFPQVDTPLQKALQLDFDASVCFIEFGSFCLSDLPLLNVKFSTHQKSSCFDRLSLPGMNRLGLVIVVVVVVNNLAVDRQAEQLGQLSSSDLSIWLTPKQWFEGEKGDSGILKLPFLSFPLLVPNSWRGYLFVAMVSELIFSDL